MQKNEKMLMSYLIENGVPCVALDLAKIQKIRLRLRNIKGRRVSYVMIFDHPTFYKRLKERSKNNKVFVFASTLRTVYNFFKREGVLTDYRELLSLCESDSDDHDVQSGALFVE